MDWRWETAENTLKIMNTGRPIHLDLDMPAAGRFGQSADAGQQAGAQSRRDPEQLADDAGRLRALLDQGRSGAAPQAASPVPGQPLPAGPLDLFAPQLAGALAAQPPAGPALPPDVDRQLAGLAQRLLVDDGSGGRRAVHIELDASQFPGTVLDITEEGGRLQAVFTCSHEPTRERLAGHAQWLADGLAERLARAVSLCVQTDDPQDRCPVQASAG